MEELQAIPKPQPRLGWKPALFALAGIVIAFYGSQIVGGLIVYLYPLSQGWSQSRINDWLASSVLAQFVYVLISEIVVALAIIWMMRLLRWTRQTIGLIRPKLRHIVLGAVAVVPYYALYMLIVFVVQFFAPSLNIDQKQQIGFDTAHSALELILTFVSLVVLPPLVEEVAMRGFLYTGLKSWLPKIVAAVIISALFGAAHLAGGGDTGPLWIGALDTFALSLVLVSLRELTGNLWAGITLHALKNSIAFALLFILHTS